MGIFSIIFVMMMMMIMKIGPIVRWVKLYDDMQLMMFYLCLMLLIAASSWMDWSVWLRHSGQNIKQLHRILHIVVSFVLFAFNFPFDNLVFCPFWLIFTIDHSCNSSWPWPSPARVLQDCEFHFSFKLLFLCLSMIFN